AFVHAFPFSPRTGTPAARMPQLDRAIVKQRAARLREAGAAALARHLQGWVGREAEALIEREGFARLPDFTSVVIPPSPREEGVGGRGETPPLGILGATMRSDASNAGEAPRPLPPPLEGRGMKLRFTA